MARVVGFAELRVVVDVPEVEGQDVLLGWQQDEPNELQKQNRIRFRYEGLEAARFAPELYLEILLSLQLPLWAFRGRAVHITLPQPLPAATVAWWKQYHRLERDDVVVEPVTAEAGYSPWRRRPLLRRLRRGPVGVFYGGGKDSTLTWRALSEVRGEKQVELIQFVHPFVMNKQAQADLEQRQQQLMLEPVKQIGTRTHVVHTDFLAQLTRLGRRARPQSNLYAMGALPVALSRGLSAVTYGYCASMFWTQESPGGTRYSFSMSRPETAQAMTEHLRATLGSQAPEVVPSHYPLNEYASFTALRELYPDSFASMVMCTQADVDSRWCARCKKCAEYVLFSAANGYVDPDFDYQGFLSSSRYVERLLEHVEAAPAPAPGENLPWHRSIGTPGHFASFCHALHELDPDLLSEAATPEAVQRLRRIKDVYGNRAYPYVASVPRAAVRAVGSSVVDDLAERISTVLPVIDDTCIPHLNGNTRVSLDYRQPMPWPPPRPAAS